MWTNFVANFSSVLLTSFLNDNQFTMEMAGNDTGNMPNSYSLNMSKDFVPMCIFSETNQGKHSMLLGFDSWLLVLLFMSYILFVEAIFLDNSSSHGCGFLLNFLMSLSYICSAKLRVGLICKALLQ